VEKINTKTILSEKIDTKTTFSELSIQDLLGEILMEIAKAKKLLDILFEQELTEEEIVEIDTLTPEEEQVLRMRFGIAEALKGSLDNNIYKKEGQVWNYGYPKKYYRK